MFRNKNAKTAILLVMDFILINFAYFIALYFRVKYDYVSLGQVVDIYRNYIPIICVYSAVYIGLLAMFKQYRSIWTIASIEEFLSGVFAIVTSALIILASIAILDIGVPRMIVIMASVVTMLFCNGMRISWRIIRRTMVVMDQSKYGESKRVLVVGAGAAGALVASEFKNNPELNKKVVSFVDDNKQKNGTYLLGIPVEGNRNDIVRIVEKRDVKEIVIAISHLEEITLKEIIEICSETKAQIKIMPGVYELMDGNFSVKQIRDVDVEDLLGRDTIELDRSGISKYIEDKVIMVTGGGGSIGSELCRQIAKYKPKQLIIFDIYENNAYDLQNELLNKFEGLQLKTLIGSVRDAKRLDSVFSKYRPEVVFHAAAHKHVPLMEESPAEAIKNNVRGTLNTAEMAKKYKVKRFVLISTDKAVNPTNVMGATKRLCEMIIQSINRESETEFAAVRFGNVLGSNGSVVPLFKRQIEQGGPVTLTHKDITRYFMTIPEAAQLVIQAATYARGGEIFVLDMGKPVRIYDLAKNLIRLSGYELGKDMDIEITGLRPGEKLYEELLMEEEGLINTSHKKIFIAKPGDFSFEEVKKNIEEITNIISLRDGKILREKLHEIVPTYNYSSSLESFDEVEEVATTI